MGYALGIILFIAAWLPLLFWKAYVAALIWKWFVVPLFNLPEITTTQMAGVIMAMLAVSRVGQHKWDQKPDGSELLLSYTASAAYPLITLVFAAIVKFVFM